MSRRVLKYRLAVAWVILAAGCSSQPQVADDEPQWYRAQVVTRSGAAIPFFLELPADCTDATATIANGEERLAASCGRSAGQVTLDFPVYGTRVTATVEGDGRLSGAWTNDLPQLTEPDLRFEADPVPALDAHQRFAAPAAMEQAGPDLSGVWRVELDLYGPGKLTLEQDAGGVVWGAAEVRSEYGDLRFLAGNVHGNDLQMSMFDGGHAFLLRARLNDDGALEGELVRGDVSISPDAAMSAFTAERTEAFEVADPLDLVRVTSDERQIAYALLDEPRYAGKPVIVEIFGTWCPNCNDLAPLLVDLHERYEDDGLEMLGIAYELSNDETYSDARLAAFREKHGIDWELRVANVLADALFDGPAELSPIEGVPVTIFLNRDRTIHAIYAGFSGPATGESFEEATATFERLTAEILESE